MPTFSRTPRFMHELKKLTSQQRQRFESRAITEFVVTSRPAGSVPVCGSTRAGHRRGLGDDLGPGRAATFEYGPELRPGEPHVTWRRVRPHDIFNRP